MSRVGILLALFTLAHTLVNLAYSPGITSDEGWVLQGPHNLLHHGLYGTWDADGAVAFDPHMTTGPAVVVPMWVSFAVFGEGLFQARVVSAIYGALAVLVFYVILRLTVDTTTAAVGALALSFSLYPYNHAVVGEVAGLFWMLLGGWFWILGLSSNKPRHSLIAGICFGMAGLSKLTLVPLAAVAVGLSWAGASVSGARPRPGAGFLLLPLASVAVTMLGWFGLQATVLGWGALGDRLAEMTGYQQQLLPATLGRVAQNALALVLILPEGLIPWWPIALFLTPVLLKTRLWKEPRYSFWAVLLANCGAFYLFSVGWPRYGFWAVALGIMFLAWMLSPFTQALLFSRPGPGWWAVPVYVGLVTAILAVPALKTWQAAEARDDSAERVAMFLKEQVGDPTVVGTTEWSIDFLTGWRLKHPPPYTLPVSPEHLDSTFDWSWPNQRWVVTGIAGEAFGAERRLQSNPRWQRRYSAGPYQVFQRNGV